MPQFTVAFLGPEGTHSHEACLRRFGARLTPRPCRTFREVLDLLPEVDAAVVPVENSVEGPVTQTLDLLAQRTNLVVREAFDIPIRNHLAARPQVKTLTDVRVVYSHPQVLGQCEQWLHQNLPHADLVAVTSTAEAARRASKENHVAAAAGQTAIAIHKLKTLAEDIQDMANNATRFLVLTAPDKTRTPFPKLKTSGQPQTRTLIYLILHDAPGALLSALVPFDRNGVNLTFIQSRPLPGRAWDYGFFVEVDVAATTPALRRTLQSLAGKTQVCRLISSYICYGANERKSHLDKLRDQVATLDHEIVADLAHRCRVQANTRTRSAPPARPAALDDQPLTTRIQKEYQRAIAERLLNAPLSANTTGAIEAADRAVVDAVRRRLRVALEIAQAKSASQPQLRTLIATRNPTRLEQAITQPAVEKQVITRIRNAAREQSATDLPTHFTDRVADLYRDWIIPFARRIQVEALLESH